MTSEPLRNRGLNAETQRTRRQRREPLCVSRRPLRLCVEMFKDLAPPFFVVNQGARAALARPWRKAQPAMRWKAWRHWGWLPIAEMFMGSR